MQHLHACGDERTLEPLNEDDKLCAAVPQWIIDAGKWCLCLCCFRCYLVQRQRAEQLGRSIPEFSKWMDDRRELGHLLTHLNLDT